MHERAVAYYPVSPTRAGHPEHTGRIRAVAAFVRERGWVLVEAFVEARAARGARRQLARALDCCREQRAQLVIPELAPLARDPEFLAAVLTARVRMVAADTPRVGRRSLELLRAVATRARDDRAARSRAALQAVRNGGVRLGSPHPEIGGRAAAARLRSDADARAQALAVALDEIRLSNPGASLRQIGRVLEALGVNATRGGRWGASSVRNLLRRIDHPKEAAHGVLRQV
jgi:DNA invertase Pin-like site-specific DNA recombinase